MKQSSLKSPDALPSACRRLSEAGTSLLEVLAGLALFSAVGLSLVAVSTTSLRDLGLESRATLETFELKRGLALLASELRMSSFLSPYLPGTNATASDCSGMFAVDTRTVSFFVALDEASAAGMGGLTPYYVGYRYDPARQQLLRGEIPATNLFTCDTSIGDPASAGVVRSVASNVVEIDTNGDGVTEPAFEWLNGVLRVNLGVRVEGGGAQVKRQNFSTRIYGRVL